MLYIIYGLTTVLRKATCDFFDTAGIEHVEKLTFETKDVKVQPTDGRLNRADSEETVRQCDYVYENHGRVVGFTADQIEAAVTGKTDAYLTFSTGDLSFLREIKNAYGDHVTSIYIFTEEKALETITNAIDAPEEQKRERLNLGRIIKECYLTERELFDETVIFSGENTTFDIPSLSTQYATILAKYKERESKLPPLPYKGNDPYIFVSYSRKDTETVIPLLNKLNQMGCRIWYDKGIKGGENWMTTLAMKIRGCSQYLLFSSENSTKSVWTKREARKATKTDDIEILTVRMDDAHFDEGIEWVLEDYQQLFLNDEDFEKELFASISEDVIDK